MAQNRFSRTRGGLWVPEPSRRAVVRGASASAAALLLGCGTGTDAGNAGGPGGSGGTGGGGAAGSGGAGGSGGTGGSGGAGGAAGTDGSGGAGGAAGPSDAGGAPTMPDGSPVSCVLRAEQTEGPFHNRSDDPLRADIRSEPSDGSVKLGVPLRLVLRFGRVQGSACLPLEGALVDVWQCDALGIYAGYQDAPGQRFLRGYQSTDRSGTVEFLTIYPGAYQPRPIHIHFSVRTSRTGAIRTADPAIFVSQLYFPLEVSQEVLRSPAYSGGGTPSNNTAADRPWVLNMERDGVGWRGLLDIAVQLV